MARKRIGELLLERGAITPAQLDQGLERQRQTRQRLGLVLLGLGFVSEDQLVQVLSQTLQIPVVELRTVQPEWTAVHMLRARFCETHDLFPFALEQLKGKKALCVAMSDPLNQPALEEIEFTTGLRVSPRIASVSQIRTAILRYYHKVSPAEPGGGMTIVQPGGHTHHVPEPEAEDVIEGEELAPEPERPSPPRLTPVTAAQPKAPAKKPASVVEEISADLEYLFGGREEPDAMEALERKFWALLRLMQKKGLLTKEEFNAELERDDDGASEG